MRNSPDVQHDVTLGLCTCKVVEGEKAGNVAASGAVKIPKAMDLTEGEEAVNDDTSGAEKFHELHHSGLNQSSVVQID